MQKASGESIRVQFPTVVRGSGYLMKKKNIAQEFLPGLGKTSWRGLKIKKKKSKGEKGGEVN